MCIERGIVINMIENQKSTEEKKEGYYSNRPKFGNRGPSKLRQQFNRGMSTFLVVAMSIMFYFVLLRFPDLSDGIAKIISTIKPIIYGLVIAYLLNPIIKKVDQYFVPVLEKNLKKPEKKYAVSRACGIFLALITLLVVILTLFYMLIPQLYQSIRDLVIEFPEQMQSVMVYINNIELENGATRNLLQTVVQEATDMFEKWLRTDLLAQVNNIMSGLTVGIVNLVGTLLDLLVGVIVSIYVLYNKDTFSRQAKKVVYAVFSPEHANLLLHITKKSHDIFGGFIIGKIIDSAIIGVLCFFGCSLLKIPYVMLISVIVGVTNVIPYFGPFIGAIPSAILILLVDPWKGLYFIIFIIFLQQLDGNFIGPKILGESTGLSSFWVIFAILISGGLFGFAGMLLGVPTFAVILYLVKLWLNHKLEKKNLPTGSDYYDEMSYVGNDGVYVHSADYVENDVEVKQDASYEQMNEKENEE